MLILLLPDAWPHALGYPGSLVQQTKQNWKLTCDTVLLSTNFIQISQNFVSAHYLFPYLI